jgi:hypothetical protein
MVTGGAIGYDDDDGGNGQQWHDNGDKGNDNGATMTTMTMNATARRAT